MAVQFLAVFTEDQHVGEGALRRCLLLLEEARNIAATHPADVVVVETRQDLERALTSGRIGLVLAIEGSEPVAHSLGRVGDPVALGCEMHVADLEPPHDAG